ncbi:MAG: HAD-IC family P-type ATPase [Flavobacteriales bacterium]|nr:HAD-IC family P-type ATPase [Flavobacteriales bacterium]
MNSDSRSNIKECFHCGDKCPSDIYMLDDHLFCCNGCKTVYSILKGSGLEQFYSQESSPGVRVKSVDSETYAYLDEESIQERLILFNDGEQAKVKLHLPTIHCSSCLWLLENLHRMESGINAIKVDFAKRMALISFAPEQLSLRELAELLHSIGYAPHISLASEQGDEKMMTNKSLITKIGVTGFLFGNIMLLSFPEYLSTGIDLMEDYRWFFSGLILLLSLPVLLYGARDYYRSSWVSLVRGKLVIDVPIAIGITAIFLRSLYDILMGIGPGYLDSMSGLVFFLLIGKWYQAKIYDRLSFDKDFSSYFPLSVIKSEGGKDKNVPVMELKENDRLKILHQGIVPADCELISNTAEIDYSFVTGESKPVEVLHGQLIYAGGKNLGSATIFKVKKRVSQSYLTDLWNQPAFAKDRPGLSSILDRASAHFTLAVLGIAVMTGVFWYFNDVDTLMDAVTSVLIVACPCALALSVPFALGNVRRLVGKKGFFTRSTDVLETMAKVDVIVFDKTGTLTEARDEAVEYVGVEPSDENKKAIGVLASQSAHPHSKMISGLFDHETLRIDQFNEVAGQGVQADIGGHSYRIGSSQFVGIDRSEADPKASSSWLSVDGEVLGRFLFHRRLREGVPELITNLKGNKECYLLSGDNDAESWLLRNFLDEDKMHFGMSPMDKMQFISALQSKGKKVMMLGDGLNDAGALKQSDVGIAVSDDINLFSPSCDAILEGDRMSSFYGFMKYIDSGTRVVKWSMLFSILYNVVGISIAVQGLLTPLIAAILMPLSSVTIVLFATLSTSYLINKHVNGSITLSADYINIREPDIDLERMIPNRA